MLLLFELHNCSPIPEFSLIMVQKGKLDGYYVLQILDRKAYNVPSEAELYLRIAKERQE